MKKKPFKPYLNPKSQTWVLSCSLQHPPWKKMWRAIDAHSKTIRFSLRTALFSYHQNPLPISSLKPPKAGHFFSLFKTLSVSSSTPNTSFSVIAFTTRHCNNVAWGGGVRGGNLVVARCISSISASAAPNQQHTAVDWNEPVSSSDVGVGGKGTGVEVDTRPSIPVRAFFFSTRFSFFTPISLSHSL